MKTIIKNAVAVIIYNSDRTKILLLQRGPEARNEVGKWENPGGQLEPTISPEERAKERVREEIGVEISKVKPLFVSQSQPDKTNTIWRVNVFEAILERGEPRPQQEAYCSEIRWISIDKLEDQDLASYTRKDFIQLELIKPKTKQAVAVIIYDAPGSRILLMKRGLDNRNEPGKWENPGGEIEPNEDAKDAARREVMEELGIVVHIDGPVLHDTGRSDDRNIKWSVHVFKGKIISGSPQIKEKNKCSDVRWFDISELSGVDLASYTKRDFTKLGYLKN